MILFRVVQSREAGKRGWAVEWTEDGAAMVVSRVYMSKDDAECEAGRLNGQIAKRTMRYSGATAAREAAMPHEPGQDNFRAIHDSDMDWRAFPAFPPEARLAVLVGDPSKPGPYMVRVKLPDGVKLMPHAHPEDRIYTVISGIFYIGLGEDFDESKLMAFPPGAVVVLPGGQPHFHWAKSGEYVTQVSAIGPLGLNYVDPRNDPRSRMIPR